MTQVRYCKVLVLVLELIHLLWISLACCCYVPLFKEVPINWTCLTVPDLANVGSFENFFQECPGNGRVLPVTYLGFPSSSNPSLCLTRVGAECWQCESWFSTPMLDCIPLPSKSLCCLDFLQHYLISVTVLQSTNILITIFPISSCSYLSSMENIDRQVHNELNYLS